MKLNDVGKQLSTYVPDKYAEPWDNVGWMVGSLSVDCTGVLFCVDPSPEALDRAISENLNLIFSHHPLIFESLNRVTDSTPLGRIITRAIQNEIGIFTAHTNADSMPGGLNDVFASQIELKNTKPLEPHDENPMEAGLGRIGILENPTSLSELTQKIQNRMEISHLQILGDKDTSIKTIAVCTGSGGDFITQALSEKVDLYITGDVDHHKAMEAKQLNLPLVIMDHYEMETVFLSFAEKLWYEQFGDEFPAETFRRTNPYSYEI